MSGNDNSFEKQMIDFYGQEKLFNKLLDLQNSENVITCFAAEKISFDIAMKSAGLSKNDIDREINRLQVEMYEQLEKDRQSNDRK